MSETDAKIRATAILAAMKKAGIDLVASLPDINCLDLIDALERLVRAPEERGRMGAAGREKVRADYDVARSARRMRSVLEAELGLPT